MRDSPIVMGEFESWDGALESTDYHYLIGPLRRHFATGLIDGGGTRVTAQQFVGSIVLPSGRQLTVRPKVPIGSVFQMMSDTLEVPPDLFDELIQCQDFSDALELVAAWFASLVERQIEHGLFRRYVEVEDSLPMLRGRIVLERQLRATPAMQHRLHCRFSELTWDIPENQLVRQVVHDLSGFAFSHAMRMRLQRLDVQLAEVRRTSLGADVLRRFTYNRLNHEYALIHALCELFLVGSSLTEGLGSTHFLGFLVNMNSLFERYVTTALQARLGRNSLFAQLPIRLSSNQNIYGYPDLTLVNEGKPVMIADCKYKRARPGEYVNADLYQVTSYCLAAGTTNAVLIYPRHELPVEDQVAIANTTIVLNRISVDLSKPGRALELECDRVANAIALGCSLTQSYSLAS